MVLIFQKGHSRNPGAATQRSHRETRQLNRKTVKNIVEYTIM